MTDYIKRSIFLILVSAACTPSPSKKSEVVDKPLQGPSEWTQWVDKARTSFSEKFAIPTITHHTYLEKVGDKAMIDLSGDYPRFTQDTCMTCKGSVVRGQNNKVELLLSAQEPIVLENNKEFELPYAKNVFVNFMSYPEDSRIRVFLLDLNQKNLDKKRQRFYFSYNNQWRVDGRFQWFEAPQTVTISRSDGSSKEIKEVGQVAFSLNGKESSLSLYNFYDSDDTFKQSDGAMFLFRDLSNGKSTYGAGRFLTVAFAKKIGEMKNDDLVVLDFNYSYNPPCATSTGFHCPLPQNLVNVDIQAGEKAPLK